MDGPYRRLRPLPRPQIQPISQKDFYRLFAFFNQVPGERGFTWNYGPEQPFVKAPTPAQQNELDALDRQLESRQKTWDDLQPGLITKRSQWHPGAWTPTRDLVFREAGKGTYKGEPAEFNYLDPFTFSAWIKPDSPDGAILTHQEDYIESQGHGLFLMKGRVRLHLTQRFTDLGLRVETVHPIKLREWQHVLVTYDGKRLASGVRIYVNSELYKTNTLFDQNNEPFKKKDTPIRVGSGGGMAFDGENQRRPHLQTRPYARRSPGRRREPDRHPGSRLPRNRRPKTHPRSARSPRRRRPPATNSTIPCPPSW